MTGVGAHDDPLATLRRWEDAGGRWQVIARHQDAVTVTLVQCTGGEVVDRFTSTDPQLLAFLADRWSSDD